ncbi:hypothetical protein RFI_30548 [Reticulomyxa filosa]|uniref:Uncharacterized protein n=1 Tax=Reticulomyxa filosa TaxID=46433 RepID=X6LY54_RETFI|nr:hypothetical protein RFI_30548 [Reticulomyxa filosa]|eukprot:ETO06843.1 hypothetical protein RFI_30548 [Reticulomyxa filosa]
MESSEIRMNRNKKLLQFMHLSRSFHLLDDLAKLKLLWKLIFQILCNCENDNRETTGYGDARNTLMHQVLLKGLYEYIDMIPLVGLKQMVDNMEVLRKAKIPASQDLRALYKAKDKEMMFIELTAPNLDEMESEESKTAHWSNESSPPSSSVAAATTITAAIMTEARGQPISPSLSRSPSSSFQVLSPPNLDLPAARLNEQGHPLLSITNKIYSGINSMFSQAQGWIYGKQDDSDDEQVTGLLAATNSSARTYHHHHHHHHHHHQHHQRHHHQRMFTRTSNAINVQRTRITPTSIRSHENFVVYTFGQLPGDPAPMSPFLVILLYIYVYMCIYVYIIK